MATVNEAVGGVKEFQRMLKLKTAAIGPKLQNGLTIAGLFLQRESQLLVPVDFGILKASAFTRRTGANFATVVNVGYTAYYAMYVHENVEMKGKGLPRKAPSKGNYWDPAGRGQAKFLEEPARRLRPQMFAIIKKATQL